MTDYNDLTTAEMRQKIDILQIDLDRTNTKRSRLDTNIISLNNRIINLQQILSTRTAKPKEPEVSTHALIRYAERVYNVNFDQMRDEILDKSCIIAIKSGAKSISRNGVKFIIRNDTVVTAI